ncbi:Uma2 family endonuclease [Nocardiopsis sp. NRRL B-16309]|uniref:Uma2 family endonuclease n=1 Tax=Nocardiopsis sp. NRRL B-16309 TaxID=1519494 RepID=UPI001E3D67AC|nr:Uma2 family endonuclease [Nocardiopsis sp. NRRL B-16309]
MDLPTLHESLKLPDGYRSEIIDGSIIVSPTPTFRHSTIIKRLERALDRSMPEDLDAYQMLTLEVSETGDRYVPDLAVLPETPGEEEQWDESDWILPAADLELAVEVASPGSALHDRQAKVKGYATAGVPLYLVIDPLKSEIALLQSREGEYLDVARAVPDTSVKLPEPFNIEIEATPLLT